MPPAIQKILLALALVFSVILGTSLRVEELSLRPMHTDEAVQAYRMGELLAGEGFEYNPSDGHGPGLLLFSLPVALAKGATSYLQLDEATLRLTPAIFGIALIAAALLFRSLIGNTGVAVAALLTAISPMHVFFSRYYIMELPMVLLLAAFLFFIWKYFRNQQLRWMIFAGAMAALMHATKETFVISIFALVAAALIAWLIEEATRRKAARLAVIPLIRHITIGLILSLIISAALYSLFFTNIEAIPKSYSTYLHYLDRAEGSGHEKPFMYYMELLAWKKMELYTWSEILILMLCIIGAVAAFIRRDLPEKQQVFLRLLALYALLTLLIYSAIAYKTPWSILAFLHAGILLAGFGFGSLLKFAKSIPNRFIGATTGILATAILLLGCSNLLKQDQIANFKSSGTKSRQKSETPPGKMETLWHEHFNPSNRSRSQAPFNADRNPYIYSHTSPSLVSRLVAQVRELGDIKPELSILVCHPETGWPLPYYFRAISNAGYPQHPRYLKAAVASDVIICDAAYDEQIADKLGERYIGPDMMNLRDNVMLHVYIERELFFEMVERRSSPGP
ncbi:MAG: TIGR03663 family protein [Verrucomicrobiaceae bacterium]|nr:TIGR03663 family protein [Verrucomicrobiaceae bacterium]